MNLYDDKEKFDAYIKQTADGINLSKNAVKKDYYVTLLLKEIAGKDNNIIFKGGTSLSKAWEVIERFSEDIDLTCELHPTEGKRKNISRSVIDAINKLNLKLASEDKIRSRSDYNAYEIEYDKENNTPFLKDNIIVETTYFLGSFPSEIKTVSSYIYKYYKTIGRDDIIKKYELEPFEVRVQSLERTFIDKVFALCDYYIRKKYERNSRHIYDLYQIFPLIKMDNDFKDLLEKVRLMRRERDFCESAQEGVDINVLLKEILDDNVYEADYNNTTTKMFFDNTYVDYKTAKSVLEEIIKSNIFANV